MGVVTETVVPVFGNILAAAMLLSPVPAVLRVRQTGKLGDLNPLPYPMTAINCAGWVAYGYAVSNPFIFPANVLGFLAGMVFSFTAFGASPRKTQDLITAMLTLFSGYVIMLGLISCFALDAEAGARMWGTSAVVILMLYYFVPLSTMVTIVRTRNAASIYPPLAVTAILNGTMWSIYGFEVGDINLWLPNLFGSVIGLLQLALRLGYGARPASGAADAAVVGLPREDPEAPGGALKPFEERQHSGTGLLRPGTPPSHFPDIDHAGAVNGSSLNGHRLGPEAGGGAGTRPDVSAISAPITAPALGGLGAR
ncbi:hypothetical protein HYH03_009657 [Edaphochlamys debaryana]|uniref:Bidirectional sugar transporter SWEET n=1 Tax=Edaphochlamys debaryana TaxID=47281 RepID=A0A836BXE0_9CHLO|nr:hypothetical protein HYH03_009657 [Edaphochlamys debaryana]|eukprot:KAG2491922.1 hypothetical protein HYH03_009657 [Edaphochlamys debaryana]